jgi:hypothetical protein
MGKAGCNVNVIQLPQFRFYLTTAVLLAELAHLSWEHFHGGVQTHHFLRRTDLPAISNGWGLVLLPVLTWFLTGRTQKRMAAFADAQQRISKQTVRVVVGFVGALLLGSLLSISFALGDENVSFVLLLGTLLLGLLLPIYRAECVLGFVLGMTFTFGPVIPTVIGSIIAMLSATLHLFVYVNLVRLWNWVRQEWAQKT